MKYYSRNLSLLIADLHARIRRHRDRSAAMLVWPEEIEQIIDALETAQREVSRLKAEAQEEGQ